MHPRWGLLLLASAIILATYAVLIETWRRIVIAWGDRLHFGDAARIWAYSNLVRYVPGNTFIQVGAVAELARRQQVSPAAAAGSAAINTIVNIATGFVVALVAGWSAFNALSQGHALLGTLIVALLLAGLLALPGLMPIALSTARRITGREIVPGVLPRRGIYVAIVGNIIAWVMYGLAFQVFVGGILGAAPGTSIEYIAVYASAYVIGYLAFWLPAGVGPRDAAIIDGLSMLGLVAAPAATVVAACARLWTTVLEIVPALFFLARGLRRRPQVTTPSNGSHS